MNRPASNPGDLPLIDGLFSGRLKRPPVGELLGTEYVAYDVAAGTAHLRFTALPSFINPGGTVHGGMLAAMLDELMAVSMSVAMREGEYNITLDLGTRFLKAAELGPIDGFGKLIKRGRAVGFVEGSSSPIAHTDEQGNPYQIRGLDDGSVTRVLKNFPGPAELLAAVAGLGGNAGVAPWSSRWMPAAPRKPPACSRRM